MTAEQLLAQKDRQLELLLALDDVRDMLDEDGNPKEMFQAITVLLKTQFAAEACGIMLLVETTSDEVEYAASSGVHTDVAVRLCREALKLETPGPLSALNWAHTLGLRIVMHDKDTPLGGLFMARQSPPFSEEDLALLQLAESQIDSAVMQARMIWKLAHRNHELEAIYQIDRLRDNMISETDLINKLTSIMLEQFAAELCVFTLTHIDSGEFIVRGVVDKTDIPAGALEQMRAASQDITIPQVISTPEGVGERLRLLAAPFIVSGVRLGSVIIGRRSKFTVPDHRMLFAMMSQIDSAIVHGRIMQQLSQRNRELETIYRIDEVRDSVHDFEDMLQRVLIELCQAVACEVGYIMLYKERSEEPLELKATTQDSLLNSPEAFEYIRRISRQALDSGQPIYANDSSSPVGSIIAVPLILNDRIIGVFGVVNSINPRGFNTEDQRMLSAITSQIDTAIFERLERRRMRKVMSRSVDSKVLDYLLQHADDHLLEGERVTLTVLFADVRGSTEWAERIAPEELVSSINLFLSHMTEVIFKYGGTLDKFVGDEVIGLFGTPLPMDDHAYLACRAALEMQAVHEGLRQQLAAQGRELPPIGIGVSSGEAIAGEFGPSTRSQFTAMGRIVNLGARLCSAAGPGQTIISQNAFELIESIARVEPLEPIQAKGIAQPVRSYSLLDIEGSL